MSDAMQALCFLAGANSIFYGDKLLTTGNPDVERDRRAVREAGPRRGLKPWAPGDARSSRERAGAQLRRDRPAAHAAQRSTAAGSGACAVDGRDAAGLLRATTTWASPTIRRSPRPCARCARRVRRRRRRLASRRAATSAPTRRSRGASPSSRGLPRALLFSTGYVGEPRVLTRWREREAVIFGPAEPRLPQRRRAAVARAHQALSPRRLAALGARCSRRRARGASCWSPPTRCSAWTATWRRCPRCWRSASATTRGSCVDDAHGLGRAGRPGPRLPRAFRRRHSARADRCTWRPSARRWACSAPSSAALRARRMAAAARAHATSTRRRCRRTVAAAASAAFERIGRSRARGAARYPHRRALAPRRRRPASRCCLDTAIQPHRRRGARARARGRPRALFARGLLVAAIRAPTVPRGLRGCASRSRRAHEREDVEGLARALARRWRQHRMPMRPFPDRRAVRARSVARGDLRCPAVLQREVGARLLCTSTRSASIPRG